jgi:hypothetical protein
MAEIVAFDGTALTCLQTLAMQAIALAWPMRLRLGVLHFGFLHFCVSIPAYPGVLCCCE